MGRDPIKNLQWNKGGRPPTDNKIGFPTPNSGSDGDIQIKQTTLGARLFGKIGGRWYHTPLAVDDKVRFGTAQSDQLVITNESLSVFKDRTEVAKFSQDTTITGGTVTFHDGTRNRLVIGANDIDMYDEEGTNVLNIDTGVVTLLSSSSDKLTLSSAGIVFHAGGADVMSLDSGNINMTGKINITSAGTRNVCIGAWASTNPDQGDDNIVIGSEAGSALGSGSVNNIMIGTNAGVACQGGTNADNNVMIGAYSGKTDTSPDQCIVIGNKACEHLTQTRYNIAIGYKAMQAESDGGNAKASYNVAIGTAAMADCHKTDDASNDPHGNVAVGHAVMQQVSGDDNVAIGVQAGNDITTGSDNICIGHTADVSAGTASNQIVIGQGSAGHADNKITLGNSSIVNIEPHSDRQCHLGHLSYEYDDVHCVDATEVSDERLKEEITNTIMGLDFINKLRPVSYKFKDVDEVTDDGVLIKKALSFSRKHQGLIAQEVKLVLDDMGINSSYFGGYVDGNISDNVDKLALRYRQFIAPLIKAVQELSTKIDTMQTEINKLKEG